MEVVETIDGVGVELGIPVQALARDVSICFPDEGFKCDVHLFVKSLFMNEMHVSSQAQKKFAM